MKRHIALVLGCGLALVGFEGQASADIVTLSDASGLEYEILWDTGTITSQYTSTYTGTTSTTSGGTTTTTSTSTGSSTYTYSDDANADEAEYTQDVTFTTTSGGTEVGQPDDMFDGYNYLAIDGTVFRGMSGTTSLCEGREVDFGEETISGLTVSRRAFVPEDDEFLRFTTLITNPGAAAVTVAVTVSGNMGSDDDTVITASSSGDTALDLTDTWFASGGDFDDPRAGHVMQGEGASVMLSSLAQDSSDLDEFTWGYDITIEPGETVILLNFVTGQPTNAAAAEQAAALAELDTDAALRCLTNDEIKQVVNFDAKTGDGGCGCAIPGQGSSSPLAPLGLGLLLGAFILRRRLA